MRKKEDWQKNDENTEEFRPMPLYGILICAIILIFTGLHLTATNETAIGQSQMGRSGGHGGEIVTINGPFIVTLGIVLGIFPAWQLVKQAKRKKS